MTGDQQTLIPDAQAELLPMPGMDELLELLNERTDEN